MAKQSPKHCPEYSLRIPSSLCPKQFVLILRLTKRTANRCWRLPEFVQLDSWLLGSRAQDPDGLSPFFLFDQGQYDGERKKREPEGRVCGQKADVGSRRRQM